jgi:hypothetical protein
MQHIGTHSTTADRIQLWTQYMAVQTAKQQTQHNNIHSTAAQTQCSAHCAADTTQLHELKQYTKYSSRHSTKLRTDQQYTPKTLHYVKRIAQKHTYIKIT